MLERSLGPLLLREEPSQLLGLGRHLLEGARPPGRIEVEVCLEVDRLQLLVHLVSHVYVCI